VDPDFSGYATRAGLKCTDGRTITPEAFQHMDKKTVPLVWQHMHKQPENVLGHGVLEHRKDGMYIHGFFNDTPAGKNAKMLVEHGDVEALSIYANQLIEKNKSVQHGNLIETSLVLAGANPGAKIDYVRVQHSDDPDDVEVLEHDAVIYGGTLEHAGEKTYQDVYDTLDADQQELVAFMVAEALGSSTKHSAVEDTEEKESEKDGKDDETTDDTETKQTDLTHSQEDTTMTRNVFENNENNNGGSGDAARTSTLTHSQIQTLVDDGRKMGSFKDAVLAHADEYGITNIEVLFPDAQAINNKPEWITRRLEWVEGVLAGPQKLPFSKIKSLSADLTHEEARAKGYVKATMKKEQFFEIAKRETGPKTIYKKQKLDRDDIIDITDFDVVAWIWVEMNFMLREEIARAILVGDGREVDDEDKIDETKIRPIAHDNSFYTDVVTVAANTGPDALVEAVLRNRDTYKGTTPKAYMTNAVMTDMLLVKDGLNRRLYRNKAELASELGVTEIVEVPVMEGVTRDGGEILMLIVNLSDYAIGSTRGGEITKFDDFDIDFNQYKYLIEGRMSGALTKHKTAQVIIRGAGTLATPTVPTFNSATGVVTIPSVTGVLYKNGTTHATLSSGAQTAIAAGASIEIEAEPASTYYFPHNFDSDWVFTRDA
jgi:HK97 family phage prohead protease